MKTSFLVLSIASGLTLAALLCVLLTNNWIQYGTVNFGVLQYCNSSYCQDVTEVLNDKKEWIRGSRNCMIIACVVDFIIFAVSFPAICCGEHHSKLFLRIFIVLFFILGGLVSASTASFLIKVSFDDWEYGYSLIVQFAVLATVGIILFGLVIIALFCENVFCVNGSVDALNSELRFAIPPGDVSVNVGNNVLVKATVENAVQVRWFKGRDRVLQFSAYHSEEFDHRTGKAFLKITAVRMSDNGEYACVAVKPERSKTKEIRYNFSIYVLPVQPVFKAKLQNVTVIAGETILLEAEVENSEIITWYHNHEEIRRSKKVKMLFRHGKASLIKKDATVNDSGEYICSAKSGGSPQNQKEEVAHCKVVVHKGLPPSFEAAPKEINVIKDRTIDISLKVNGFPRPTEVKWFKDHTELQMSRRILMQYSKGLANLNVYKASSLDSGLYECYVKNKHGNDTCRIPITVEEKQAVTVQCPICMDRQPNAVLECGHAFCKECIAECIAESNNTCPSCRRMFREPSNLYL